MNKPEISVIMPIYNSEKFLEMAIKSILNQTFTDFEFIIIDDGSEDKSSEIVKNFNDARIKFFEREKLGISEQLNFGIEKSSSELIARMDADDLCYKDRLKNQFELLKKNKSINLVGTNFYLIDEKSKIIGLKKFPENQNEIEFMMPILTSICHASMMTYKKIITAVGNYSQISPYAEDQELFLRIISHGYRFYNIQEPLYYYRIANRKISKERRLLINNSMYENGYKYLTTKYKNKQQTGSYFFQFGLLEYYHGNIHRAQRYFWKVIKSKPGAVISIMRYFLVTLLGNTMIKKLRDIQFLDYLSISLNKYLKIDLHSFHKKIKNNNYQN
jgi:glycosyltransferase involved in cell wall biosynthesis